MTDPNNSTFDAFIDLHTRQTSYMGQNTISHEVYPENTSYPSPVPWTVPSEPLVF